MNKDEDDEEDFDNWEREPNPEYRLTKWFWCFAAGFFLLIFLFFWVMSEQVKGR